MTSPHDFKAALATVSHLYFKATAPGKTILGSSLVTSSEKWKLSIGLLSDTAAPAYYEKTMTFSDISGLVRLHIEPLLPWKSDTDLIFARLGRLVSFLGLASSHILSTSTYYRIYELLHMTDPCWLLIGQF